MNTVQILFSLLRSEICGGTAVDNIKLALTAENLEKVYTLATKHDLVHIVGQALGSLGLLGSDELSKQYKDATRQAYGAQLRMQKEFARICRTLEAAQIPFIPLKGAVIRRYYPEPWLRNSCDIDILVKPETLDKAICELETNLSYTSKEKAWHDVSLFSPSGIHLELHFMLVEETRAGNASEILARVWDTAEPKQPGSFQYVMADEMFYFYHIAHMAKHFEIGGCGIRPFLDLWILNRRLPENHEKRRALLAEGKLLSFAEAAAQLSRVWFSNLQEDSMSRRFGEFVITGGSFGNSKNKVELQSAGHGTRLEYIWSRLFLPYDVLKYHYAILQKHRWLTPVYQIVRWIRLLLSKKARRALRVLNELPDEQNSAAAALMEYLGL